MAAIIHPLWTLLASLTRPELARQVTYLKAENQILRSKLPKRIELSNQERRRLVKHGKSLGARIKDLISIVSYSTFRKWVRSVEEAPDKRPKAKDAKPGRPRVEESISIDRSTSILCLGRWPMPVKHLQENQPKKRLVISAIC